MIWVHHGDGKWTARGHGRHWKIERARRNPDYDVHTSLTYAWLYSLLSCPLDAAFWEEVKTDCATPQEAREAAPTAQSV